MEGTPPKPHHVNCEKVFRLPGSKFPGIAAAPWLTRRRSLATPDGYQSNSANDSSGEGMAARSYRLTAAGRDAWEGQDAAVPADYRRILWMMDVQGHGGVAEALSRLYPPDMLEEWLGEMEELGLIESLPEGEADEDAFVSRSADTMALDQAQLREAAKIAGNTLARTGAYVSMDRLRRRPAPNKEPAETVVLIVEDDPDQLALADLRVSMAGYKVRVASSVNGFLQALVDEGAPDLLLLDVMLPDGDGFDVLGKMRRHQ